MRRTPLAARLAAPVAVLVALAILAAACSGDGNGATGTTDTTVDLGPLDEPLFCDPLDERACLLPWPNDAFTVPDPTTATGRRLDIQPDSPPQNADGTPIDVTDQNRADGFSPGSAILVFVPQLDFGATGIAPSTDIGKSLEPDSPLVVLDTTSGERIAYWGEMDATAPEGDQVLIVHPADSLPEGHHFVVALRHLVDTSGAPIVRTTAFEAALDGQPEPSSRAKDFFEMFDQLEADGVIIDELFMAWDFTVASTASLSDRLLHMRTETYDALGADGAPAFTAKMVFGEFGVRWIDGTFEAPNYLAGDGGAGNPFALDAEGLPMRNTTTPTVQVPFRCLVPMEPDAPVPAIVYGHGLMGNREEVNNLEGFVTTLAMPGDPVAVCAIDEIGMSAGDIPTVAAALADLSHFSEVADRLQQGHLEQQLLGRLLNSADGFATSILFQKADGSPIIAMGETVFLGNSQGGILGGAASAISTEWNRVVLGVPGIDYSLLLPRSTDWTEFAGVFEKAYTDPADRLIAMQLIQLLWDRGENDGYVQHLATDPYPGIEAKQVLLVEAFGDHQVANVSTEVLARTLDAVVHQPALRDGRSKDGEPLWGIDGWQAGSTPPAVLVMWDYGTPAPPTVNLPPAGAEYGADPHGAGAVNDTLVRQVLTFLASGQLLDVCGDIPCTFSG